MKIPIADEVGFTEVGFQEVGPGDYRDDSGRPWQLLIVNIASDLHYPNVRMRFGQRLAACVEPLPPSVALTGRVDDLLQEMIVAVAQPRMHPEKFALLVRSCTVQVRAFVQALLAIRSRCNSDPEHGLDEWQHSCAVLGAEQIRDLMERIIVAQTGCLGQRWPLPRFSLSQLGTDAAKNRGVTIAEAKQVLTWCLRYLQGLDWRNPGEQLGSVQKIVLLLEALANVILITSLGFHIATDPVPVG